MNNTTFPIRPFDGQEFIDATRVRWTFNAEDKSWQREGVATEIPVVSSTQSGLLSAKLKQLLDSIPEKGGQFGIIARPLLSVVPLKHETLLKDTVQAVFNTETGSTIRANSPFEIAAFEEDQFVGKLIYFLSGELKNRLFLISGNTDSEIRLIGNAGQANTDDKFEVIEPTALNLNGIIAGNIELVSESVAIECVDANDDPIDPDCTIPPIVINNKTPALDFKVSDLFKSQFCVQQPGCIGPRGDRGPKGMHGEDGTGDGPKGEQGNPGKDAPDIPIKFDGIKMIDIDDIYDTAVVAIEVDAKNSRLNIVKAKMHTPDDLTPASQVVATEIFRDIEFTGHEFDFNLLRPPVDPVGTDDLKLAYYPQGFEIPIDGGINRPQTTGVCVLNLSDFIKEVSNFWQVKFDEISKDFDQQIKTFIETKDKEARLALAQLCHQLSECEWEKPFEFCLSVTPNDCNPLDRDTPPDTPPDSPPGGGPPGGGPPGGGPPGGPPPTPTPTGNTPWGFVTLGPVPPPAVPPSTPPAPVPSPEPDIGAPVATPH